MILFVIITVILMIAIPSLIILMYFISVIEGKLSNEDTFTKGLFGVIVSGLCSISIILGIVIREEFDAKSTYCGPVIEKFTRVRGKSSEDLIVVFFNKEKNKKIALNVDLNTYVNAEKNKTICFELRKSKVNE